MTILATLRQLRRVHRIESTRAKMQKLSNERDELRAEILELKRELLELEIPAPLAGQVVEPQGFEVDR